MGKKKKKPDALDVFWFNTGARARFGEAKAEAHKRIEKEMTFTALCVVCQKPMEAKRITKLTCSTRCRVAHHRMSKERQKQKRGR
jgi:predicted nucleic acid-binding Zn ribbon protein